MFNNGIKKVIGYGIAGVLTIGGASVIITNDDVAQQYKANTGKELTINESELISFEESLKVEKEERNNMQALYDEIDCNEYEDYKTCTSVKSSIQSLVEGYDASIDCDNRIISKDDLEKSDITFCVDSQKQLKDAVKNFYITLDGVCDSECQETVDVYEYNIAMFQAYLNKLD